MKFLTTVAIFASAAVAAPNPKPLCFRNGMPCWEVKRAAEAFADAVQSSGGLVARGEPPAEFSGIPNDIATSALESLHDLASLIAYTASNPKAFFSGLGPDQNENTKRDVAAVEDSSEDGLEEITPEKRWCFRIGMGCWKAKRAAEAVLRATSDEESRVSKRSFEDEASPEKRWCFRIGMGCWKAKRDLESIQSAAREILASLE